jgi:hypothetical protein
MDLNEMSVTGVAMKIGDIVAYIRRRHAVAFEKVDNVRYCSGESKYA